MQALLTLCFLSVLFATGTSLQCEVCNNKLSGKCSTSTWQTCGAGEDTCIIAVTKESIRGVQDEFIVKGCGSSSLCNVSIVELKMHNEFIQRTSRVCCVGEACRTASPQWPQINEKRNGRRCSGCYNLFSKQCFRNVVDCTGVETKCVGYIEELKIGSVSFELLRKGCATETFCTELQGKTPTFVGVRGEVTVLICSSASSLMSTTLGSARLFLSTLTGLLMMKLLMALPLC
uniref:Phospholipase A2 inhibitor and Ly6/PLAUR domain-containing protein-like n=1 Tax=Sphenodon punctatus TaxID=8508 RepID=A0A8D0HB20_SPHPU